MVHSETVEGYVVDIACLRKYPASALHEKAAAHGRSCSFMGHCLESGYALVNEERIGLLDETATPMVFKAIANSVKEQGIRLRVTRTLHDGAMQTVSVDEVE